MNWLNRAWTIATDAIARFNRHDGAAMAGYIAFTSLLSIFPFLIFATTLTGILIGSNESEKVIEALFQIVPEHVALTLEPVATDVLDNQSSEILTAALLFAVWTASNAVNSIRVAFDRAYEIREPRGFLRNRALAIVLVFFGAIVAAVLGFSILLGPLLIDLAQRYLDFTFPAFVGSITYAFGIAVFVVFISVMHRTLPGHIDHDMRLWPGVLTTTLVWLIAASGFSYYLSYSPSYTVTYGTLAGVMITLMFFYITGAAIIFGAEVNAALHNHSRTTENS